MTNVKHLKELCYLVIGKIYYFLPDKIAQPVIVRTDGEENFYEGEDYELECRTASATVGMTYVWKKWILFELFVYISNFKI